MMKAQIYREKIDDWVGRAVCPLALTDARDQSYPGGLPKEEEWSKVKVNQVIPITRSTKIRELLIDSSSHQDSSRGD